jgi:DNA-binding transcriptional regulator YiaG
LFLNGKNNSFASAIVMWEMCNILTQRQSIPWDTDEAGYYSYQRQVNRGRGLLKFWITENTDSEDHALLQGENAEDAIAGLDMRSACLNLIYAAHAMALDRPWEEDFVISDQQIERYLGLDRRKDLSKLDKLSLIKELAEQPCRVIASVDWPRHGKIESFSIDPSRLWHLRSTQYHFQEDQDGQKHLMGLTFTVRSGQWAEYFLNQQGYWNRSHFYQYGNLPRSLLTEIMSNWQQHEGAVRMMLWLLFKTKIGKEQRITVQTLLRVAYGEEKVINAVARRGSSQKRLLRTFENDLEVMNYYGLKPVFDPETYPPEIQPLWAKLENLPDDAEAALEFWTNDGSSNQRLTDAAPRGKWRSLLSARLLSFDCPEDWERKTSSKSKQKRQRKNRRSISTKQSRLAGSQIVTARKRLKLSQRALAEQIGKSQSWIRDVEKDRFQVSTKDQALLRKILKLGSEERTS